MTQSLHDILVFLDVSVVYVNVQQSENLQETRIKPLHRSLLFIHLRCYRINRGDLSHSFPGLGSDDAMQ